MSSVDILVPDLPESVVEATVAIWHKKPGDAVTRNIEVPAAADGILEMQF